MSEQYLEQAKKLITAGDKLGYPLVHRKAASLPLIVTFRLKAADNGALAPLLDFSPLALDRLSKTIREIQPGSPALKTIETAQRDYQKAKGTFAAAPGDVSADMPRNMRYTPRWLRH